MNLRTLLRLGLPLVVCAHPGWASTTVTFQDGVSPTAAYAGTRDISAVNGFHAKTSNHDVAVEMLSDSLYSPSNTLLRFDLSSIGAAETVTAAALIYTVSNTSPSSFRLLPLRAAWTANQATWLERKTGVSWGAAGAGLAGSDYANTLLASLVGPAMGATTATFNTAGVAEVQSWVSTPANNLGFLVPNDGNPNGLGFWGCDYSNVASRVALSVTHNATTTVFRNGSAPTAGYAGCTDTFIAGGGAQSENVNGQLLGVGGNEGNFTLLKFDVSSIPPDVTVRSASLVMTVLDIGGINSIYPAARDWTETGATWLTYDGTNAWQAAGGAGASDVGQPFVSWNGGIAGKVTISLPDAGLALVQGWIDGTLPNYGVVFGDAGTGVTMADREYPTVASRPRLTVVFDEADAGAADAGNDAGSSDAGAPDASTPDAGAVELRLHDTVGCGCSQASGGALQAGALLLALLLLRARVRRSSPPRS